MEGLAGFDFEESMDQMMHIAKDSIISLDIEPELAQLSESIKERYSSFDFRKDEVLELESIVKAVFANPERERFTY